MLSHCLKCRKYKNCKSQKFKEKNYWITTLSLKRRMCDKKSRFVKGKEDGGFLSSLRTKPSILSKITIASDILL